MNESRSRYRVGVDTGGTYTDAALFDEGADRVVAAAKALTTRHDLAVGIRGAVAEVLDGSGIDPASIALVSLSTTLATNALVEGQGGRVALVLIGFDEAAASRAGIAEALRGGPCVRIGGGHDAAGRAGAVLHLSALDRALSGLEGSVDAFAVAGMFAVRNPEHEIAVREHLRERTGRPVTCGHELSSRLDAPRRAMTCVLNARLVPIIHRLLEAAERSLGAMGISAPMMVVRGDGALVGAEVARSKPVETILSGPAASIVGAYHLTGERDAVVADIGGTTTDHALLVDGRPRLDPDGATVGGFRTMVEAVAMRTVGLGGDSEVRWASERPSCSSGARRPIGSRPATGQRLVIGPRRLVPLSLLATEHPGLVAETLERQCAGRRRGDEIGRFAVRVDAADRGSGNGRTGDWGSENRSLGDWGHGDRSHRYRDSGDWSRREAMLLDRLAAGPVPLDRLIESQAESGALESLVGRGRVMLCGVTPTDAAHVLGLHREWDVDAARAGIALFAEQRRDGLGGGLVPDVMAAGASEAGADTVPDAESVSRAIIDALADRSAEALLDGACEDDGYGFADLGRYLLRAVPHPDQGLVTFSVRLGRPVIGLGAPAPVYYPAVAARLGTRAVIPAHAGVANAIGAVVGRIRIRAVGTIAAPDEGRYRVFAGADPRDFPDLEAAVGYARDMLEGQARQGAIEAGAADVDLSFERHDRVATVAGRETLVESTLTAVASGRPRFSTG